MAFVATQNGLRSVLVAHADGHWWRYEFPIGSTEPDLRIETFEWADAAKPDNASALTALATAKAMGLARRLGLAPEFEVLSTTNDRIRVRDIDSRHEFEINVVNPAGERLLGKQVCHPNPASNADYHRIMGRVLNYAQKQMFDAGRIDRIIIY